MRKYSILLGIGIAVLLLLVAAAHYPGGSAFDKNAAGFDWQHNYFSNLFNEKAVNGQDNAARFWALAAVLVLCASIAVFFVRFSKKMPSRHAANVIKYAGAGSMISAILVATPFHDQGVMISGTLFLVSMFYIVVYTFKSKLHLFKIYSATYLLIFYVLNYVYYTRHYLEYLAILQKINFLMTICWVLYLEYFTKGEDFAG